MNPLWNYFLQNAVDEKKFQTLSERMEKRMEEKFLNSY